MNFGMNIVLKPFDFKLHSILTFTKAIVVHSYWDNIFTCDFIEGEGSV